MFVAPPGQARNRALAAALRLARFEALGGLFLLVRGEGRLAAQFDALFLGVGLAARGALQNAAALQLRGNAENGEDDLGEVGGLSSIWRS